MFIYLISPHICRYYAEFPCNFDLRLFPFDEQSCPMEFKMRNAIKAQVIMIIREDIPKQKQTHV